MPIVYDGYIFKDEEEYNFYKEMQSVYDVGTLVFKSRDSLKCALEVEGEVCSNEFTCTDKEHKEYLIEMAKENKLSVSWN